MVESYKELYSGLKEGLRRLGISPFLDFAGQPQMFSKLNLTLLTLL